LPRKNVSIGKSIDGQMQSPECFEQVALPHITSVYRAAVVVCGQSGEAEDLTQATFLKALERFDTFEPRAAQEELVGIHRVNLGSVEGPENGIDPSRIAQCLKSRGGRPMCPVHYDLTLDGARPSLLARSYGRTIFDMSTGTWVARSAMPPYRVAAAAL
jgi:hypothetical protein